MGFSRRALRARREKPLRPQFDWNKKAGNSIKSAYEFAKGARKRGSRALLKHGLSGAKALRSGVKAVGSAIGNKGKSVAETNIADRAAVSASGKDSVVKSPSASDDVTRSGSENSKDSSENSKNEGASDNHGSSDNKASDSAENKSD